MEYEELIAKLKENILKEAWRDGYDTGFDEAEEDAREKYNFTVLRR